MGAMAGHVSWCGGRSNTKQTCWTVRSQTRREEGLGLRYRAAGHEPTKSGPPSNVRSSVPASAIDSS
jgi:hypothetical protein